MIVSGAAGVIVFFTVYALLIALFSWHRRRITLDTDEGIITWHDLYRKNWRFVKTVDEIQRIHV